MDDKMKPFKILDCFCGLGGASEGFYSEGFDCTGIDIINMGYPYHFIHADMLALNGKDFHGYDVMWGSPPCRDFTQLPDHHLTKKGVRQEWKRPKQPEVGMVLVKAYLNFVREAQPQFWILENVKGLIPYLGKPVMFSEIKRGMKRGFWGNFPYFLMPCDNKVRVWNWDDSPTKAKIPFTCSQAFARACKDALTQYL